MNPAQHILAFTIRFYRWVLSPAKTVLFGPLGRCRYSPSCSQFALEAVQKHGAVRGGWLALRRLARCHPWGGCGQDPVPAEHSEVSNFRLRTFRFGVVVSRITPALPRAFNRNKA